MYMYIYNPCTCMYVPACACMYVPAYVRTYVRMCGCADACVHVYKQVPCMQWPSSMRYMYIHRYHVYTWVYVHTGTMYAMAVIDENGLPTRSSLQVLHEDDPCCYYGRCTHAHAHIHTRACMQVLHEDDPCCYYTCLHTHIATCMNVQGAPRLDQSV